MGSYDYSSKNLLEHDGTTYGDWRDDFHRDGVAIIKNVITPGKAEYYRQKQIEWLQSFGLGFDPNDKSTWTQDHLPVSFKGGIANGREPKIQQIFADLWGTDELLCSFDGMNITLPQQRDLTWSPWPHCDQNPQRKGMQCVQGLLNLAPNGPLDGGLVLMKGSSKLFDAFFRETRQQAAHEDAPPPEEDFRDLFIFTEQDVKWFEDRGCELVKTCLGPGDFVLWDSRTMHYARHPEGDVIRSAQYICMTPARFAAKEDLDLKARMFETHQGTTHWPHW
ncbi:hypothetical protein SLS54_001988 [Diplodia seriata]